MDDAMKRLIVVLQSKGILITVTDLEFISGVISENAWLGFDNDEDLQDE